MHLPSVRWQPRPCATVLSRMLPFRRQNQTFSESRQSAPKPSYRSPSDSQLLGCVFSEQLPGMNVAPDHCCRLVARLTHDPRLADTVSRSLGHVPHTQTMTSNSSSRYPGAHCGALEQLPNRIGMQSIFRCIAVSIHFAENRSTGDSGFSKPRLQAANRTRMRIVSKRDRDFPTSTLRLKLR